MKLEQLANLLQMTCSSTRTLLGSKSCSQPPINGRNYSGCLPDTVLSALHVLIHLILLITPWGRHHYLHFLREETGTERLTHPGSHREEKEEPRLKPRWSCPKVCALWQLVTPPQSNAQCVCMCVFIVITRLKISICKEFIQIFLTIQLFCISSFHRNLRHCLNYFRPPKVPRKEPSK